MAKSEPSKNGRHELQVSSTHVMRMSVTGAGLQQAATGCATKVTVALLCKCPDLDLYWQRLAVMLQDCARPHRQACGYQHEVIPSAACIACTHAEK